jgi:hypothetical protein
MPNWKPVELVQDYWIIQDEDGYTEYVDHTGHNLMFTTKEDAQTKIDLIKEFENA